MEPNVKKALMIVGLVLLTVFLIKLITNAPTSSGSSSKTTTTRTVVVDNDPHRYYYGFGRPATNNYNSYKAQYYN